MKITTSLKDDILEIMVKDNGKGIIEEQLVDPNSFGILEIRERISSLGGEAIFKGIPNKGTIVKVRIPIH